MLGVVAYAFVVILEGVPAVVMAVFMLVLSRTEQGQKRGNCLGGSWTGGSACQSI